MEKYVGYDNIPEISSYNSSLGSETNSAGGDIIPGVNSPMSPVRSANPDVRGVNNIGWSNGLTFSSTAYNTITWTTGTITYANGFTYNIIGGTSATFSAITNFYIDEQISSTTFQASTTASDSVGPGKLLVCVAKPTVSGKFAEFQVFGNGNQSVFITADNIAANTITANEINVTNLFSGNISVTGQLYGNKSTYASTTNGFWLGNDSGTYKFNIGDATTNLKWDGSGLTINGSITATAGSVINGSYITNATITAAKTSIAAINSVDGEINANKVGTLQIDTNAVTEAKILAGAITAAKTNLAAISSLTGYLNSNTVDTAQIVTNAVTSLKILDGAITSAKTSIASINATTGEINANKVGTTQIDTNAVTSAKILDGAITATKTSLSAISAITGNLNTGTVDTAQLVNNAVTSLKILDANITTAKIATGAITEATIATNAITNTKISDDAITTPKIFAGSITTAKIAANAVTANEINAGAITTAKIFAGAVTSNELASNSIVAGKIAAGTIVANDIASNAITAVKISAGAVTANKLTSYNFIVSEGIFNNNTPIAGSVSWVGVKVVYNGTEYTITNGDTALKYVYWQLATPTVFATSATLPTIGNDDFIVLTNTSGTYTLAWNSTIINGNRITAGSIVASNLATGTITANEIASGAITTVKIFAGAITSNELASNSVVAGKIAAGTIVAGDIATNAITAIKINAGAVTANKLTTYNFILSAGTFASNSPGAGSVAWTGCTVVYNGIEYSITNNNTANKYIYWQLATPTVFATSATLPAYGVDDFLVATNTSGSYILAWNSTTIDGGRITAGSVVASQLVAGTITANEIASGTITALKINTTDLFSQNLSVTGQLYGNKTTYTSTTAGFWLGNDTGTYKFNIGNDTEYLKWNGSNLVITGSITLTNTIPSTSVSGLGSLATQSSVAYGDITGTKPPSNADVTLSAIQGSLTLTGGGLVLASGGSSIRGGQTAYDTGIGFWIGDVTGTSKFSIGNSAGNKMIWNGTDLEITGKLITGTGSVLNGTYVTDNTITAAKISVTSLSAITADMGSITAGTITLPSGGHIKGGQTAYSTGTGFYLGNDSGTPKFSIGDSVNYMKWDGTGLDIKGGIKSIEVKIITAGETIEAGKAVCISTSDGLAYKTNPADSTRLNFVGFCNATVTVTNTTYIDTNGIYQGLSGLSSGVNYYLSTDVAIDGTIENLTYNSGLSDTNTALVFAYSNDYYYGFQTFTASTTKRVNSITVKLKKVGSGMGPIKCYIRRTSGNTVVGESLNTLVEGGISTSYTNYTFDFGFDVLLDNTGSEYYYVSLESTTISASNYYIWGLNDSVSSYTGGQGGTLNTSRTMTSTNNYGDKYFQINIGATIPGEISSNYTGYSIFVGKALNSTTLQVDLNNYYYSDIYKTRYDTIYFTRTIPVSITRETITYNHTLGKIPTRINIKSEVLEFNSRGGSNETTSILLPYGYGYSFNKYKVSGIQYPASGTNAGKPSMGSGVGDLVIRYDADGAGAGVYGYLVKVTTSTIEIYWDNTSSPYGSGNTMGVIVELEG